MIHSVLILIHYNACIDIQYQLNANAIITHPIIIDTLRVNAHSTYLTLIMGQEIKFLEVES